MTGSPTIHSLSFLRLLSGTSPAPRTIPRCRSAAIPFIAIDPVVWDGGLRHQSSGFDPFHEPCESSTQKLECSHLVPMSPLKLEPLNSVDAMMPRGSTPQ